MKPKKKATYRENRQAAKRHDLTADSEAVETMNDVLCQQLLQAEPNIMTTGPVGAVVQRRVVGVLAADAVDATEDDEAFDMRHRHKGESLWNETTATANEFYEGLDHDGAADICNAAFGRPRAKNEREWNLMLIKGLELKKPWLDKGPSGKGVRLLLWRNRAAHVNRNRKTEYSSRRGLRHEAAMDRTGTSHEDVKAQELVEQAAKAQPARGRK